MKKQVVKNSKKKKLIIIFSMIFILILLLLFGTKGYLYVNLLLGSDLALKLNVDTDNLFLVHYQKQAIKFDTSVITNPFCDVSCNYDFVDLSNDLIIDKNNFTIKPTISVSKEYILSADKLGSGVDLYRFNLQCKNTKTLLCHTNENTINRNILITVNYDLNNDEKSLRDSSKLQLISLFDKFDNFNSLLDYYFNLSSSFNFKNSINSQILDSRNLSLSFNSTLISLKDLWHSQNFYVLNDSLNNLNLNFDLNKLNDTINSDVSLYNSLIDQLNYSKSKLTNLKSINLTNSSVANLNNLIIDFNNASSLFLENNELSFKQELVFSISSRIDNFNLLNDTTFSFANETLIDFNFTKIELYPFNYTSNFIVLNEASSQCCFLNNCDSCYFNSSSNYPILFVHGHAFNKGISAEYSLDTFNLIQEKLESDNYINAGSILTTSDVNSKNILGRLNLPVSFRSSYYFDIFKTTGKETIIETKSDNIDTYSIRLKDIIDTVKFKTGKDKVIIVAHSMGGLVARRYIQIFGTSNLDKVILIGTPNKGIAPSIFKYCNLFGSGLECNDMSKDSLFINKLNNGIAPDIPFYNIIGVGCDMEGKDGDGVVLKQDVVLDFANNYFVNGTCSGFDYLHTDLINPDKYPEVYNLIDQSLEK